MSQAQETSFEQESYGVQASERIQSAIRQAHGKERQMIYGVDRWVKVPQKLWANISPAVHDPAILLNAALGTVFSNPRNYLSPGWDSSKIHTILIVSKGAQEGAPITIPSALKKKIAKDTFAYDFYLPQGLSSKEILQMMQRLQREIFAEENPAKAIVEYHEESTKALANDTIFPISQEECGEITTSNQPPVIREEQEE
ncbi:MAG: hypothetical protein HYY62_00830, partial [Deltaproteobacteria bacterium]|nr:hypothetical protein [Deltaproteobacteria bacterium]